MKSDNEDSVTGDHAKNINAITRQQEKKLIMDSLPKKAQDLLSFNIRKYDGRNFKEAANWIKDIEEWLRVNNLCLMSVFDLLLSDEAAVLWKDFKTDSTTKDEAKAWFMDTFTIKKSITEMFVELAGVKQQDNERFATFEIRVKQLLDNIFNSELSRDEILKDFISKRTKNSALKEKLISKPKMNIEDIRSVAKLYENQEHSVPFHEEKYVDVVQKTRYSDVVKQGNSFNRENLKRNSYESSSKFRNNSMRNLEDNYASGPIMANRNFENFNNRNNGKNENQRYRPSVSMKHVARKFYNKCMGLPNPKDEVLLPGQCYCCGERDHLRFECPLKNKCLICGKEGHLFRNCILLNNRNRNFIKPILCIYDENNESCCEDKIINHDIEAQKNSNNPVAYISSVGLSQ